MQKRYRRALLAALSATTALAGPRISWAAQSAVIADVAVGAISASGVEDVVVTARKRSEKAQDVPIAITALAGAKLAQQGISQIQQLQFEAPSLNVATPNPRQTNIAIRGIGNNPAADGLSASVGLYIDGVYLDRPGMANFDLLDVDRVEVLRGPQGTLFGKNTTAGALSVSTKAPTFTPEAEGEVSVGDYNLRRFQATASGPINDQVAVRLAAYSDDRDGYLRNINIGGSELGLHRWGVRSQVLYKPTSDFSLRLIGEFAEEADSQGAFVLYNKGPASSASPKFVPFNTWSSALGVNPVYDPYGLVSDQGFHQRLIERQGAVTADAEWSAPGGFSVSSITAYRHWTFVPHNDFSWGPSSALLAQGVNDADSQFSQELRVASPTGGAFDYVAGAYFFWRGLKADSITTYGPNYSVGLGSLGNPSLNNGTSVVTADPDTKSYAAFAQGVWHIDPRLSATLGLRETYEVQSESVTRLPFSGGTGTPPTSVGPYQGQISLANATPSALISLSYKPTREVLAYALVSYGAKAGGFNSPSVPQTTTGAILPIGTLAVKPETAVDVEAGVKATLLDHRLILDGDLYWTELSDYQANTVVTGATGTFQSLITNVGKVRSRGFELEATAVPVDGLNLNGSVGYNDAVYLSFPLAPSVQGATSPTQSLSGRPVVEAPRWTVSLGGDYSRELARGYTGFVGGGYAYKSGYYGYVDDSAGAWLPAYAVVNARIGLRTPGDHYELSLWVNNAFDARSFSMVIPASTGSGGYFALPAEPRFFGATLKASF